MLIKRPSGVSAPLSITVVYIELSMKGKAEKTTST
jgi:hypothetical protein